MKKFKYIIALFSIGVLSACSEDFLVIPSQTNLTSAGFYKTEADYIAAVNGVYANLENMYNGYYQRGEMHSDNAYFVFNKDYRATGGPESWAQFTTDVNVGDGTYNTHFQRITRANFILDGIDEADFNETSKNDVKGQALFLRAFSYWDMGWNFEEIPIHLSVIPGPSEAVQPRQPSSAVLARVIADLNDAIPMLKNKANQQKGRVTSGSAKMLLGSVYIWQKDWANAETILKDLVDDNQYSLMANYGAVFDPANKNNSESVFEIQYQGGAGGINPSNFIYNMLPYPMAREEVLRLFPSLGDNAGGLGTGEGYNTPTPDLIAEYSNTTYTFGATDLRLAASIDYAKATSNINYPFFKKFAHDHSIFGQTNDDWFVYRYSEALLGLAEALNEQGGAKSVEALQYLNMVRNRAGLADWIDITQANLRDAIRRERRVELAGEGKRWHDLVRYGNAESVMKAHGAKIKANPTAYYNDAGGVFPSDAWQTIELTWPFPPNEETLRGED